ncbi:MAG: DUF3784 domain-containing protein [Clostridiales bacterium]|nr:DUF3784 domain-containing protein [Clostridiales bacterium]
MLPVIHGIFAGIFIILGIVFLSGKGLFLIAGYNTASKAEKAEIDEKKLCKYVGILTLLFAGCFLLLMASDIFDQMWLLWFGLGLFFVIAIGGAIYINTGNRLKK